MTPAARVAATIELLDRIAEIARPADGVVSAFFRGRRYIGSKDRADIAERVYAVLRHQARLGWWLARLGHSDDGRARVMASLALIDGRSAADIAGLFDGGQYAPARIDAAEREMLARIDGQSIDHPEMPDAARWECPDWAAGPLRAVFGESTEAEAAALLLPAPLDLRVNEAKATREEVLTALAQDGIGAEPTPLSPLGIRVAGRPPLGAHPLFRNGSIEVQDEGSQLVALLVDARSGQQIVDFCAGAGGKTLALAARMAGKGRVVACDVSEGRLIRAKERMKRAGIDNVEPKKLTSERDKWVKRQKGKFDRVLIDAPCSGVGAWRRNPDSRWRPTDIDRLTALQASILSSAGRLVKPGGLLIYATCSLLPPENEERVAAFLAAHADFEIVPVAEAWAVTIGGECPSDGPFLLLTPARHGTDGFFAAILRRSTPDREEGPEPPRPDPSG
ncbi:MAG: RsmB/NOP family class I SAM-dependent RNA methyltransferase [Inquilinus sp.]|nr:RsmB/NOP family class I SAM-dependent RNA methyltransferase [Inquilinus sp.]